MVGAVGCFTYHLHVSMPVAQGSSRVQSTAAVKKTPLLCLCSCTPWGYTPRLHLNVVAELSGKHPVCFTQVKVTGASPVYFALVKRTGGSSSRGSMQGQTQWLATLLCLSSTAKEKRITSNKEMNPTRRIIVISKNYTVSQHSSR